ncbi:MAG TPA: hypothetical protein VFE32_17460 [Puia sp.]|jgi:hypothetical protein|nr:hypothetical protein [Puia sp.]
MVDITTIYPDENGVIAALEEMYCYSSFVSNNPAFLFSAQYNSLVPGDILYVLSGPAYEIAREGFYAMYPFTGNGQESFIRIGAGGVYIGTTTVDVECNNPGDFNQDFGPDFNN